MKYLVVGSGGPGFSSPEEAVQVLENIVLPSFEAFMKLEAEKKIIAGGLPVGERAFVFIMEASSNEEVDRLLREIPMWGLLEWEVTALQTFEGRASQEREFVGHERDFAKKKKSR
jgi:Muconolactone delta-isomerase